MLDILRKTLALVGSRARRRIFLSALISLLLAGMEMVAFALLYVLIRILSSPREEADFLWLRARLPDSFTESVAVLTVTLLLCKSLAAMAFVRWTAAIQADTEARLASRLYAVYMRRDYAEHLTRNSAELVRNLTFAVNMVCGTVLASLTTLMTDGPILIGILLTLIVVDPVVAACIVTYFSFLAFAYLGVISPIIRRAGIADNRLYAETLQSMQEGFGGIKAVHVYDVVPKVVDRYAAQRAELSRVRRTSTFVQRLPPYFLELCVVLGISAGAAFLVTFRSREEAFSILSLLVAAALRVLPSVNRILGAINGVRSAGGAVSSLESEAMNGEMCTSSTKTDVVPELSRNITFSDVSYRYPGSKERALSRVTATIVAGEAVGIVGPSGSGKTTLVDVLLGLLSPEEGVVRVDGIPLHAGNMSTWRRQVGYVPQETHLRDASVLKNVAFERAAPEGETVEAAVWAALEQAHVAEVVHGLPEGIHTALGERGVRLSGGQRQRLGIARALFLRPRVLVLDEATSALDSATEAAIAETVQALQGDVTMLIIAHRLSTVRTCDRILLLQTGRMVADGTFEHLYDKDPMFRELVLRADIVRRG